MTIRCSSNLQYLKDADCRRLTYCRGPLQCCNVRFCKLYRAWLSDTSSVEDLVHYFSTGEELLIHVGLLLRSIFTLWLMLPNTFVRVANMCCLSTAAPPSLQVTSRFSKRPAATHRVTSHRVNLKYQICKNLSLRAVATCFILDQIYF